MAYEPGKANIPITLELTASAVNVFGFLGVATGLMLVWAEGLGGGGGGGGGQDGAIGAPSPGGGGGGASTLQSYTFVVDLSHTIDVHIGAGGPGGVHGGSGTAGADGSSSYVLDNAGGGTTLATFSGASGGNGGGHPAPGVPGGGGSTVFGSQFLATITGELAAGGPGGLAGNNGFFGNPNTVGVGQPFGGGGPGEGLFSGGGGGISGGATNGGGGGGGGAGVFGAGGIGGNTNSNGALAPVVSSGAGGGGGGGGDNTGAAGGNGGTGSEGRVRLTFFPPNHSL